MRFLRKKALSQEIIALNQNISIPTREFFFDNEIMLKSIDFYKNEYRNILSRFKYFTSLDINSKNLVEELNTNIELLLNLSMSNDEIKQYNLNDKINCLINIDKLDLYKNAIIKLEIEVTARLIALNELFNERKTFMSHNKMNALKNEMYNLTIALQLLNNKKIAIELEKNRYINNAIHITESINNPDEEEHLLQEKRRKLLKMVQVLFSDKNITIREDREHIIKDLARVERMIEIYVFKHKNDVEDLRRELEKLNEQELDYKNRDELLTLINDLEYKYLAFYEYGRDYIAIGDLMQLYLLKFNILVLSENGICEPFIDDETNDIELTCYRNVMMREIESFIKGNCEINDPAIIKIIVNILKNGNQFFDIDKMLTNRYLLNVLLSMNNKKDLINLLKNYMVKKGDIANINIFDEVFEFDDEIPLGTVYRLMKCNPKIFIKSDEMPLEVKYKMEERQENCEEANLYQFLENDLYPSDEYYFFPVGIKGINYFVETAGESHVLNEAVLQLIDRLRKLANNKIIVLPPTLKYLKGGNQLFSIIPIKSILFPEGLKMETYDLADIEVLERGKNRIVVHNKVYDEIITSDLESDMCYRWGYHNVAKTSSYQPSKKLYIEDYNSYENSDNPHFLWKNIILASKEPENELLSRAYIDVTTKYGDFCLHIEDKKINGMYGPQVSLSLYHGHHDEIMDGLNNDFNWPKYGIFRTKYMEKNEFYQWMLGFVDNIWSHPFRNIWKYGQSKDKGNLLDLPVYSFSQYQGSGMRGTIFIDGNLTLKDNEECIPDCFENLEVEEYENIPCSSKAYFGSPSEHVAILKVLNSNEIKIIYKKKNRSTGDFDEKAKTSIASFSDKKFIGSDFEKIIIALYKMPISGQLKNFIINELRTYKNLHYKVTPISIGIFPCEDYIELNKTLKHDGYDILLSVLDRNNPVEIVEKLIENITQVFSISLDDLLGHFNKNKSLEKDKAKVKNSES